MKKSILGVAALFCVVQISSAAENSIRHTQVLAASCAACHGMNGNSVGGTPVLADLDKSHFIQQMQSFRDGSRASSVMHHHAKGLTPEEIELLADYFSAQPRTVGNSPMPLGALM